MTRSPNMWAQFQHLCNTIHEVLYVQHNRRAALAYLPELKAFIERLPPDDGSIVGAEGQAIYYDLCSNIGLALSWRLREIDLMKKMYADMALHAYSEKIKQVLLVGRDQSALDVRKAIAKSLRQRLLKGSTESERPKL